MSLGVNVFVVMSALMVTLGVPAQAVTIYDERVDGDAASSGNLFDVIVGADVGVLGLGKNTIWGRSLNQGTDFDDYIFTVAVGTVVDSIQFVSNRAELSHFLYKAGDTDFIHAEQMANLSGLNVMVFDSAMSLGDGTYKIDSRISGGRKYKWHINVSEVPVAAVPLPTAIPLMITAIGLLGLVARRHRRNIAMPVV